MAFAVTILEKEIISLPSPVREGTKVISHAPFDTRIPPKAGKSQYDPSPASGRGWGEGGYNIGCPLTCILSPRGEEDKDLFST
jgi:hypothetical protein